MDKEYYWMSLDVHSRSCEFGACTPGGRITERRTLATSIPPLVEAIRSVRRPRALVFEEGPMAGWLQRNLEPEVDRLIVCDPRRNHLVAKDGDKDDPIDVEKMLRLARGGFLPLGRSPARESNEIAVSHSLDLRTSAMDNHCSSGCHWRRMMGFFRAIKSTYKKSEAAVVVQKLLEHQAGVGVFELDPASIANKLVGDVWETTPDVFEGKFGQRPHKIAVAAAALANGLRLFADNDPNRSALLFSLANVLGELKENGRLYPLNSLDHQLVEEAASTFAVIVGELDHLPAAVNANGFIPHDRHEEVEAAVNRCGDLTNRLSWTSEANRQLILARHREVVETAMRKRLPDALVERTTYLEKTVAEMRGARLTLVDRALLSSIGNLLIDSAIRKGRSIDDRIPDNEVQALKHKAIQYARYSRGEL